METKQAEIFARPVRHKDDSAEYFIWNEQRYRAIKDAQSARMSMLDPILEADESINIKKIEEAEAQIRNKPNFTGTFYGAYLPGSNSYAPSSHQPNKYSRYNLGRAMAIIFAVGSWLGLISGILFVIHGLTSSFFYDDSGGIYFVSVGGGIIGSSVFAIALSYALIALFDIGDNSFAKTREVNTDS